MATLPKGSYGDTLLIIKTGPAYEGRGDARRVIGSQTVGMLLFDNCAQVPITIPGLDVSKLPAPEIVYDRNMKEDFLKARFTDLVITYSGGDYGTIRYKGTASGVEFLNLLALRWYVWVAILVKTSSTSGLRTF